MLILIKYHERFIIPAVTATKIMWLGRDEEEEKFDERMATYREIGLILDKLILLFEYGGKYAPLAAAELAGELDW
jgi:hypothetical protein